MGNGVIMGLNINATDMTEDSIDIKQQRIDDMFRCIEDKLKNYVQGKRKLLGIAVHGADKQYINEVVEELELKGFTVTVVPTDMQTDIQFSWE
jgi:TPP-dependent indolepyruvate ferredoxin oxidoreductase alpha subunit